MLCAFAFAFPPARAFALVVAGGAAISEELTIIIIIMNFKQSTEQPREQQQLNFKLSTGATSLLLCSKNQQDEI